VLRVQKTLEDANIKLDSLLSDLMGKSGRAMIAALIAGETNPVKLASLADRRVKASPEEFREALRGRVTKHHRFLLRLHLNQIDALDAAMTTVVAASILTAIYHMLKDGTMYQDLGCNHFDRRSTDQQKKRLVKRLADLGYAVEIKPLAAMA
jgi:hypothetical protein